MSMAVGGKKGGAIADINVTPMADIMIVLLIIFMVITPMLQKGVDVKLPTASNTKERKEEGKTITVAIKKNGDQAPTTYLGGTKVEDPVAFVKDIKERLEDLPDGGKMIYLKADEELNYAEVLKVMDLVREAGVEEISLIAEKKVSS
jgi:biopolymer transport protein TolR